MIDEPPTTRPELDSPDAPPDRSIATISAERALAVIGAEHALVFVAIREGETLRTCAITREFERADIKLAMGEFAILAANLFNES